MNSIHFKLFKMDSLVRTPLQLESLESKGVYILKCFESEVEFPTKYFFGRTVNIHWRNLRPEFSQEI